MARGSPIDGYYRKDGTFFVWKGAHSWAFTFMGDLLAEGDVPPGDLEKFRCERSSLEGGRERYRFMEYDGKCLYEYVLNE